MLVFGAKREFLRESGISGNGKRGKIQKIDFFQEFAHAAKIIQLKEATHINGAITFAKAAKLKSTATNVCPR